MIGRTPGNIVAIRPMKDGVIADFDTTATMMKYFIRQAQRNRSVFTRKPNVMVCVPSGITAVEKRAVEDATKQAGHERHIRLKNRLLQPSVQIYRFGNLQAVWLLTSVAVRQKLPSFL